VNILTKQVGMVDKGWSSSLKVGQGLTTPHRRKKKHVTKCYVGPWIWDSFF
jgi:hypothetical protein